MKNFFVLIGLVLLINSCGGVYLPDDDPTPITPNVLGQWSASDGGAGGFTNFDSFKNFQYNFEIVGNNKRLDIDLESSDINLNYMIFDPLGNELLKRGSSKRAFNEYVDQLSTGKYRFVVSADRRAVGRFTLKTTGTKSGLARIASQTLKTNTQNWGALGGGGRERTFKNHFWTFDITENNTSIDTELESADTDIYIMVYDELGQPIIRNTSGSRYQYFVGAAKKGTYTVMAATDKRGGVGNYRLNVFGKVANLKKIETQAQTLTGRWANKDAVDIYTLRLTSNNSPLDIEASSADTGVRMELQTNVGGKIESTQSANNTEVIVRELAQGTYRIQVRPSIKLVGGANYTLHVHGQFTDFKKL